MSAVTDVLIKALPWDGDAYSGWSAWSLGLGYVIDDESSDDELFVLTKIEGSSKLKSAHASLQAAQSFAQADYEARIMSALLPAHPEPDVGRVEVPAGWKLVPIEPTPEMLTEINLTGNFPHRAMCARYAAMLDAAPAPPKRMGHGDYGIEDSRLQYQRDHSPPSPPREEEHLGVVRVGEREAPVQPWYSETTGDCVDIDGNSYTIDYIRRALAAFEKE